MHIEQRQDGFKYLAAHVFKVDIDALGASIGQGLREVFGAVIDTGVKTQFLYRVVTLLCASGNTDHATALELRDLSNDRPYCASSCGNDHGFTWLRLTNIEQAGVGSKAWHAEQTQCIGGMRHLRIEFAHAHAIGQGMRLPAGIGHHQITGLVVGMLRHQHF